MFKMEKLDDSDMNWKYGGMWDFSMGPYASSFHSTSMFS